MLFSNLRTPVTKHLFTIALVFLGPQICFAFAQHAHFPQGNPFSPNFRPNLPHPSPFPQQVIPQQPFHRTFPPSQQQKVTLGIFGTFTPQGVLVQKVTPDSPAQLAGVVAGDFVLKMDNQVVTNQQQFQQVLATSGGVLQMVVRRQNGQIQTLTANLFAGGGGIAAPYVLGITGSFNFQGMVIQKVYDHSPAKKAGLKVGDRILRINQRPVRNLQQYYEATSHSNGDAVLDVRRGHLGGQPAQIKVPLHLSRIGFLGTYINIGIIVDVVVPNSPATRAGLKRGDWILTVDNKRILNQKAMEAAMDQSGGSLLLRVRKNNPPQNGVIQVDLMNNSLGCWVEPAFGGLRITSVGTPTLASRNALRRGDIIFRVNNQKVQSAATLQHILENARGLLVVDFRSALTNQFARININLNK